MEDINWFGFFSVVLVHVLSIYGPKYTHCKWKLSKKTHWSVGIKWERVTKKVIRVGQLV